ncbi:hypothetical protein MKX01_027517 [Papaver californicum]|nr:hypothetical protein MKX01_027517 [Papaver californicum]
MESSTSKELVGSQGHVICGPHLGVEFDSEEAAKVYYDAYATHVGFVMCVDRRRSLRDGKTYCRRLVCNKEGFCKGKPSKSENRKPRTLTREGCKAMMVKQEKSGRWVVSKFSEEHNHPMVISDGTNRSSWLLTQTLASSLNSTIKFTKYHEDASLHLSSNRICTCRYCLASFPIKIIYIDNLCSTS